MIVDRVQQVFGVGLAVEEGADLAVGRAKPDGGLHRGASDGGEVHNTDSFPFGELLCHIGSRFSGFGHAGYLSHDETLTVCNTGPIPYNCAFNLCRNRMERSPRVSSPKRCKNKGFRPMAAA